MTDRVNPTAVKATIEMDTGEGYVITAQGVGLRWNASIGTMTAEFTGATTEMVFGTKKKPARKKKKK